MDPQKATFANSNAVETVARRLYPKPQHLVRLEHAYDNLVVLIDRTYALRFPRNEGAYARSRYEKHVLTQLVNIKGVSVPKVLSECDNPPCLITSFLPGKHMSSVNIRSWPVAKQTEFGKRVGSFASQMHGILSVEEARQLRKSLRLDEQKEEPWSAYYKRVFGLNVLTPQQSTVAQEYYHEWQNLKMNPEVVIHDDLHTENMLFQNEELTGILDFGDTNIGTPEQDLRQLYRVSDTALTAAVKAYEESSRTRLNVRAIQVWAIIQELATYIDQLASSQTDNHAFVRTSFNLNRWLSTDMWGKRLVPTNTIIRQ